MKNIFLIFFTLLTTAAVSAQQASFPRDTSYTVNSAFEKLQKKYPFIKIIQPEMPSGVEAKEEVVYRRLGERELHLDLFYPEGKSENKYPGVLLIHGGGWRTGDKSLLTPFAQQLAANGYVAISAEYRLSPEAPYPAAVEDLKAALGWMRKNAQDFRLDTTKIAILGTSAGGQLAALIGTTTGTEKPVKTGDSSGYAGPVQAIVDIDGVLAFKHPESEEGTMAARWLGGTYEEVPENWTEASALTHAGKNTPPVLFISSSFPRFHAGKNDMIKILDRHGIYSEAHTLRDSPHSFWLFDPWFEATLNYTVNFLNKVLKQQEVTIFLVGNSTVADKPYRNGNPEKGWGQVFPLHFKEGIKVENHAVNGRSTKSFIDEGRWSEVVNRLQKGDYVFIEFGHNDAKSQDPKRYAPAETTYRKNLEKFISDVRSKGGIPVLATPIVRRKFDEKGRLTETHGDYPEVVREVAKEHKVPLVDLHLKTKEMLQTFGKERSKKLFLHIEPGEYESLPEGIKDDTHLSAYGAFKVSDMVTEEIKKSIPGLARYLKE